MRASLVTGNICFSGHRNVSVGEEQPQLSLMNSAHTHNHPRVVCVTKSGVTGVGSNRRVVPIPLWRVAAAGNNIQEAYC